MLGPSESDAPGKGNGATSQDDNPFSRWGVQTPFTPSDSLFSDRAEFVHYLLSTAPSDGCHANDVQGLWGDWATKLLLVNHPDQESADNVMNSILSRYCAVDWTSSSGDGEGSVDAPKMDKVKEQWRGIGGMLVEQEDESEIVLAFSGSSVDKEST